MKWLELTSCLRVQCLYDCVDKFKTGIPSMRIPAPSIIMSACVLLWDTAVCCSQAHDIGTNVCDPSVLLWDTAVCCSQGHDIGTNVCDPSVHRTLPEVDFESVKIPAKSATWDIPN